MCVCVYVCVYISYLSRRGVESEIAGNKSLLPCLVLEVLHIVHKHPRLELFAVEKPRLVLSLCVCVCMYICIYVYQCMYI